MKKLITLFILTAILVSFKAGNEIFVGKILYKYSFSDLKGNDIGDKLEPYLGKEHHYFIDQNNYKSYDENNNLVELYNAATNTYYYVTKEKTAQKFDGATETSKTFVVKKLDKKEEVAGYMCNAIQVETDNASTIYYYSPDVKASKANFSKHKFGEWNQYLNATDGAIALKFVMTEKKQGYIWTGVATEVSKKTLTAADFAMPKDISVNK